MNIEDNENIGLKSILIGYLLHWKLFLGAFIFSLILGILYLVLYPRTYAIEAAVQLQEDKESLAGNLGLGEAAGVMKSFGIGGVSSGGINLEDELQIFQSVRLFREMVLEVGVNVEYSKPYSLLKLYENTCYNLKADAETERKLDESIEFFITLQGEKLKVKTKSKTKGTKHFEFSELPAVISLPQGTFTLDYSADNIDKSNEKMNIVYKPVSHAAEDLIDDFVVDYYSKNANIIEFAYTDYERKRGLDMLTSLIAKYNRQSFAYKQLDLGKSVEFYDSRIDSVSVALEQIEGVIEGYKQANKLTDIKVDVEFYAEQMKEIQVKLIELESQGYSITLMENFVEKPENKYNLIPLLMNVDGGEKNPLALYNELLLERSRVIQNSSMDNPLVGTLTKQADDLRGSVFLTVKNGQKTIQNAIKELKDKENALYAKMGDYPLQERGFVTLKRQQEILQGVYLILLQKREESSLAASNEKDRARIIESPYVKSKPVGPRKLFAALGILLFTILIPVVYLFCREQFLSVVKEYKQNKLTR